MTEPYITICLEETNRLNSESFENTVAIAAMTAVAYLTLLFALVAVLL